MILALDIGNTNIKSGVYENGVLTHSWRLSTNFGMTADEYGITYKNFFQHIGHDPKEVEGVIVSSVIPPMKYTIEHMFRLYFRATPVFVGPGVKTGINIRYDNPRELGADRICNAVAAHGIYGGNCITVDFGTATSIGVISKEGDFLGGAICPGLKISADALTHNTAKLPQVELVKPERIVGTNTIKCMQAGLFYGYVGQVDFIIKKTLTELGWTDARLIATGGLSQLIALESDYLSEINSTLTLEGLRMIYDLNFA